jgi:16S rRNA (guanine527-N7)-methyltransferase
VGVNLPPGIYDQLSAYLDLLLRWNAKTNLTAIRDPEQIVTRHFGESLFAAGTLFQSDPSVEGHAVSDIRQLATDNYGLGGTQQLQPGTTLADVGSGAGFPGIPIKLAFPELHVTLIESQNKKATFLKEVSRTLGLTGIEVYNGRAEQWGRQVDVVTLRAVEKFESVLPSARGLAKPGGKLCLLVGAGQWQAIEQVTDFKLFAKRDIPESQNSIVVVGIV